MRVLFSFFCVFFTLSIGAQSVDWGPEIPFKSKNVFEKTLTLPDGNFLLVQQSKNNWKKRWDLQLLKLDGERLSVRKEVIIPMEYERNKLEFKDIYSVKGNLLLFSTYHNRVKKKNYLFVQKLNKKTLTPRSLIRVAEAESTASRATDFAITFSPDSSKIGIISIVNTDEDKSKLNLTVMEPDVDYVYQKDVVLEGNMPDGLLTQTKLSNRGELFLVLKSPLGRSELDRSNIYQYGIVKINALGLVDASMKIDVLPQYISSLKIELTDSLLLLGGLISEIGGMSSKGYLYHRYYLDDLGLNFESKEFFDFQVLTAQLSKKGLEKADRAFQDSGVEALPEINNLQLKDFIIRSDLGLVFIVEQSDDYVEYQRSSPYFFDPFYGYRYDPFASGANQTFYHHVRNDIFIVNVDGIGQADWVTRIPKLQHTINDRAYFSSFSHSITRDHILFLYNDHPNNDELVKRQRYEGKQGVAKLASIHLDGELSFERISSNQVQGQVIPRASHQITADEILLAQRTSKGMKFGLLNL